LVNSLISINLTFSKNKLIVSSIFNITQQDNLGKYLGCPVFKGRPKTETFSEVVNKIAENYKPEKRGIFQRQGEWP